MTLNYGNGENVWMHPPVHRILGWYSRPSNFDLKRNVWRLNQITQIIDNEIYVKGDPAIFVPEDNLSSFTYLVMPVQVRS